MEKLKLTNSTIDLLSEQVGAIYEQNDCSMKDTLRAKLLLEEALLKYQIRFGEDVELTYRVYHILNQTRFMVSIYSASFDPFSLEENPMAFMIQNVLTSFEGAMPTWKYHSLSNEIVFTLKKKASHSNMFVLGTTVAGAALVGIICRILMPQTFISSLVNGYIQPLSNAYAGLFCVMAVLLTFFAITLSIVHIGDAAAVGAIGGRILKRFYLIVLLVTVVLTLPMLSFFPISTNGTISIAVKSIYDVLIGFIPGNIVSPFLNFNSVHIMIIGAMFGFSLLAMGQKGENLTKVFDECNIVAIYTNNFLNKFINIYVGMKVFEMFTLSNFSVLAGAVKMVAVMIAGAVGIMAFFTLRGCMKTKMSLSEYAKKMMPTFTVCLSSANFGAAFSTVIDSLFAFRLDENLINLGVNLGSVIFQPTASFSIVTACLFMAVEYNVEISLVWILVAVVFSVVLISSVPNIPGAAISVYTLIFAQLGIPSEALALIITINALMQFLIVAVDAWCLQTEIICLSE